MEPDIHIDGDGMLANLYLKLLGFYNEEHGTSITFEQLFAPENAQVIPVLDKYVERDRLFVDLAPIEGGREALEELQALGNVRIVTAPSRNHDSCTDKMRWYLEHFPTLHRHRICLVHDKHAMRATVWLDDWHKYIVTLRATNPSSFIGAIAYPYNEGVKDLLDIRAEGFHDTRGAWQKIVVGVRDFLARGDWQRTKGL